MSRNKILIVDDEPAICFALREFLTVKGYEVYQAGSFREAQDLLIPIRPDVVILDCYLPDANAVQLLPQIREMDPDLAILILTGNASIDLAVQAIKMGADNFLTKPVELPALLVVLQRMIEHHRTQQIERAGKAGQTRHAVDPFIGISREIRSLEEQARRIAESESPVLIQGETGSGKGVLARWLHGHSSRTEEAFVDINCAGLTKDFLETELFGHEKGAFTGAASSKAGLLEIAHKGTVFMDELGDMDLSVQSKLLKALEDKRFRRLGDVKERHVDIRLIAATHQDLAMLVEERKFRGDLYFRISIIPLRVPPLRERIQDIPLLARYLLKESLSRADVDLSPAAEAALIEYSWPGNIRELRNVLERALLLSGRSILEPDDMFRSSPVTVSAGTQLTLQQVEQRHVEAVLKEERGSVERTARRLGISRSSLYMKIKEYKIENLKV
jgi:DNA-binding NtrC family response regulator